MYKYSYAYFIFLGRLECNKTCKHDTACHIYKDEHILHSM